MTDKPTVENTYIEAGRTLIMRVGGSTAPAEAFEVIKRFSFMGEAEKLGYNFEKPSETAHVDQMLVTEHLLRNGFIKYQTTPH